MRKKPKSQAARTAQKQDAAARRAIKVYEKTGDASWAMATFRNNGGTAAGA